jgi:hypothetical protein
MSVIKCSVEFDLLGIVSDGVDEGVEADEVGLQGTVVFTPVLPKGDHRPFLAPGFSPRPAGIKVLPITGYIDSDGQLKSGPGGSVGVRLPANDPVLGRDSLPYLVEFNVRTPAGEKVRLQGGYFEAPPDDVTINLAEVLQPTGTPSGVVTRIAPGSVRLDGTSLVFGFAGEDIADPVEIGGVVDDAVGPAVDAAVGPAVDAAVGPAVDAAITEVGIPGLVETEVSNVVPPAVEAEVAAAAPGLIDDAVTDADIPGLVVAEVAAAPTVVAAAADAVDAALADSDNPRLLRVITTPEVLFSIENEAQQSAFRVWADGTTELPLLDIDASIADDGIPAAKLQEVVRNGLIQPATFVDRALSVGNAAGQEAIGITEDGTLVGAFPVQGPTDVLLPEISGTKLYVCDHTTGARTLVTDSGSPSNATIHTSGAVLFDTSGGRKAWTPTTGVIPAVPDRTVFVGLGDSLTKDGRWTEGLDPLIAASVTNAGVSGHTSEEVAIRQGGLVLTVTVTGGSIPASGSVAVSSANTYLSTESVQFTSVGTIAGIAGTLTKAIGDDWTTMTFTRTGSGSVTAVAGAVPFVPDSAATYQDSPQIFCAGRNDQYVMPAAADLPKRVVDAHKAMVARMRPLHKEFLVLGTVGTTDGAGTAIYNDFQRINNYLREAFGNRFCTWTISGTTYTAQTYMSQKVIYDLGITPTAGDLAAMAVGGVPLSVMDGSGTHFSAAAGALLAQNIIKPKLDSLGWTL